MKTGVIIQARMSSTRLPGKILKKLVDNVTILDLLIDRVSKCDFIDCIILATSVNPKDKTLETYSKSKGIDFYAGSEDDVLKRFYYCAKYYKLSNIIRVTADDPFKDPEVIKIAYDIFIKNKLDYVSNTIKPTFPEGIDIEIFNFSSLEKAFLNAALLSEREHVTPYIWKNPDLFKLENFALEDDFSSYRLTVDYEEDYNLSKKILKNFYPNITFGYQQIIEFLKSQNIVNNIERNEGYKKSVNVEKNNEY